MAADLSRGFLPMKVWQPRRMRVGIRDVSDHGYDNDEKNDQNGS
jgi:hypothetical protein